MMTSAQIRQAFLDFFASKGHVIVPSAPIVVKNDPTLMFTNAGMNQFKDYFLGNQRSPHPMVADTQKCLRVSGKHNDLEEVGVDTYHHTMFEMLGNWSFGDPANPKSGYFKKEAIKWSWELLTEVYKLDKERLYVTVFEGDEKENLPADSEAYNEWKKFIAEDRILKGNKKDNFWEMGDTGPCGPCTEIHVDCRSENEISQQSGKELVNNDHPQVIEIWNNVFIQFNRKKDGTLEPLPAKHVDTGMGLERLVRVLQGKTSNYDTDVFSGTIKETEKLTGHQYDFSDSREAIAFRVIADHIRAIAFTIADGQLPSNTGAGYVIRRILRRAVRYYYSNLNYKQPLLHQLLIGLAAEFKYVFPELYQQAEFVKKVIREEEEAFLRTLDKGLKRINDITKNSKGVISGKDAFELYDTYGFPVDLTKLIAAENNLSVDEKGFEEEMKQQKDRSRAATAIDTDDWIELSPGTNSFVGYDTLEAETKVLRYRKVKAKNKESFQVVLETTPFYAESGGQAGDQGELILAGGTIRVTDTKKENDLIIHFTDNVPADLNGSLVAKVDKERRKEITLHHSATHLMHAALREVLGLHVAQKGSLVNEEYLRFDFSHFAKMTDEEISRVNEIVNEKIRQNIPVVIRQMPKEEAIAMGAMALFGEKYGDTVRVVIMDPGYSIELCGGTHVGSTGELGIFRITGESAIAAGVRRIEALCGKRAEQFINQKIEELEQVRTAFKNPKDILKSIDAVNEENSRLKKFVEQYEQKEIAGTAAKLLDTANGSGIIAEVVEASGADVLKKLNAEIRSRNAELITVLASNSEGKAQVLISIPEHIARTKNADAGQLIKTIVAPLIKGGGGGQKTLATAGGQDVSSLTRVIDELRSYFTGIL